MEKHSDYFRRAAISAVALAATAILAFAAIFGISSLPTGEKPEASMYMESAGGSVIVGDTFIVEVIVDSSVPVNVFAGEIIFNHEVLSIEKIDYNNSVADLWAELPWYSNGEGTLTFGGGTTKQGGFTGSQTLIKILFKAKAEGSGLISIHKPRILRHDGLGSEVELAESKDVVFTVGGSKANLIAQSNVNTPYSVLEKAPSTDLNDDGKQSIADISIFMLRMLGGDLRYDFNLDGEVNLKDLNILLGAK